jgi:hypothetical protein
MIERVSFLSITSEPWYLLQLKDQKGKMALLVLASSLANATACLELVSELQDTHYSALIPSQLSMYRSERPCLDNGSKSSTQGLFRLAVLHLCRVAQVGPQRRAVPLPCRFESRCHFLYESESNTLVEYLPHWFGFHSCSTVSGIISPHPTGLRSKLRWPRSTLPSKWLYTCPSRKSSLPRQAQIFPHKVPYPATTLSFVVGLMANVTLKTSPKES